MVGKAQVGSSAREFLPDTPQPSLSQLANAAEVCQGCPLYQDATQSVFGRGGADARMVLIGEQPGDQEDRAGAPFVGPAGKVLWDALEDVGLDRSAVYVTNTVKHFKFRQTGKRRLHVKPAAREIAACRPWLEAELVTIRPDMVVCLGATAANALLGSAFRITKQHGEVHQTDYARWTMATYHPSALLRVPSKEARTKMRAMFLEDLRTAAEQLRKLEPQTA